MFIIPTESEDLRFPPVELASPEGLLAIGGDLRSERLLEAYRHGVFPWYNEGQPILWWSPDPRAILLPSKLRISRSLKKSLRKRDLRIAFDTRFSSVMEACAAARRENSEAGTWITPEMIDAYRHLHEQGFAHSVETWSGEELVGGLYGVALGKAFFGESMFSYCPDASKIALVYLVKQLDAWGYALVDCQLPSKHLATLGADEIRRRDFLRLLDVALSFPNRPSLWRLDPNLQIIMTSA